MRYVVVGTGNISNAYVNALAERPGSELVGAMSRSGRPLSVAPELAGATSARLTTELILSIYQNAV